MSAITITTRPDGVAVLTFDQDGSKANVLTGELWTEFGEALADLSARIGLKGLVLASAKPGIFIAGADLKLLASAPGPNDPDVRAFIERGLRVLEQLEAVPFPTCAAIDGAALGGGLEVALACDYRVCGTNPKVQLGLPEVTLGLIPGWGGTQRLPRIVGHDLAAKMLTTGGSLSADQALAGRLVDQVVKSGALIDTAAARILRGTGERKGLREVKHGGVVSNWFPITGLNRAAGEAVEVLVLGTTTTLERGIKLETDAFMRLAGSDESKRLIAEFFAGRKK